MDDEIELAGGNMGPVFRRGDRVLRSSGPWTPSVHRLLEHCRAVGMDAVPRPFGIEADGREVLEFLPGVVPAYPMPAWVWEPAALRSSAALLRRFHDASASADRSGPWRSAPREPAEVVCHNDVAPYNVVFREGQAAGLIDLDFASPGPRIWDLAYLAYRVVPLSTDRADGFTDAERLERLALLLDTYTEQTLPEGTQAITVTSTLATVIERLQALAAFSRQQAAQLANPELAEHAELYDRDAAYVGDLGIADCRTTLEP
ncbi:MAG: hypothetical protein DI611_14010 [Brachybacterium faecium]|nr:MAG: hypothetical protein DI611_14010 [Brachybacterium faecium]